LGAERGMGAFLRAGVPPADTVIIEV